MKLHFRALGDGPPLVILHGLLGSLDNWMPIAQTMAAQFRVYLLDLRNHGHSPHSEEFNYEVMAEDVRSFLADQGVDSAHVLGHSMGGKVAMRFAQLHPATVQRLVIVDMSPRAYPARFEALLDSMSSLDLSRVERRDEVEVALRATVTDKGTRQFLLKNLGRDGTGRLVWKPNLASIRANYGQLRAALPLTVRCECPALFVRGEKSDYVREDDLILIREVFPNSVIETIAGAGHWVHADAPGLLLEKISQFLLRET